MNKGNFVGRYHLSCNRLNTRQQCWNNQTTFEYFLLFQSTLFQRHREMAHNQTMSQLPNELFFSMGRLAAISSLLFVLILILVIIFLLFYQQQNSSSFDEHELRSETDPATTESKALKSGRFLRYASMNSDPRSHSITKTTSINSGQFDVDERQTQSTTHLVSSQ